jgi:RHS repeat-associated protein
MSVAVGIVAQGALIHDEESGVVYDRKRMVNSSLGRDNQREPSGARYVDGLNLYQYERSRPLEAVDPTGLQAFELNRKLGAKPNEKDAVCCNWNPKSHTFVYTADLVTEDVFDNAGHDIGTIKHWKLKHTYSWGNAAGLTTWHKDQPEDINAAQQAIDSNYMGWQQGEDDPAFDDDVENAYNKLAADPDQKHWNLIITNNCKDAAADLEYEAEKLWLEAHGKEPMFYYPW